MKPPLPRRAACFLLMLLAPFGAPAVLPAAEIAIVTTPAAAPAERLAAGDLASALAHLYPNDRFVSATVLPAAGRAILVGAATHALIREHLGGPPPTAPESFVVRQVQSGRGELGLIAGADARGTTYGVYALLTRMGCGFSLSGDTLPPPRPTAFDFTGWELSDRPLTGERLVFDWHNFLSGCSTWNPADWRRWITQAQKLGYNAIMVHAYGNNPMAGFAFEGAERPVGYLSTTVKGRDWSTMHVNDVRRLFGGDGFDGPAFGAEAGLVPDDQRVVAAQALMRGVFNDAAQRAMGVYFAVDVDTPSANPPELVRRLPESARFEVNGATSTVAGGSAGRIWVPNPDTPEGSAYYRAQVAEFVTRYPGMTTLVVWFRRGGTPWTDLKVADLPAAWQEEFAAEVTRTPEAAQYWRAPGMFAVGKIVRAFERARRASGADHVRIAAGTWGFEFLAAADRFFPPGVPLIGLDYEVLRAKPQLGTAAARGVLREIGGHRPVIPVVWAQHDDGHYIGRPYTPLAEFASKLADAKAAGFGIIHWTTRPLDLYFSSLAQQVWQSTQDRPLRETCLDLAERWFGPRNRAGLGAYLEAWITGAPRFGRETSDWFIDHKLTNIPEVVAGCRARQAMLSAADVTGLTPPQRDHLVYWRGLEEFIAIFHETHGRYQESQELLGKGDLTGARQAMAACQPGPVIEHFARFSSAGGITRGEQGLIVSLNTRWYTHLVRHRQALGLEPVRINFAPTSHDLLAQSRGIFTFHFEPNRSVWECWGAQETGAEIFTLRPAVTVARGALPPAWAEIARTGVSSDHALTFTLRPLMARDSRARGKPVPLPAGDYRIRVLLLDPASTAPGQRRFEIAVRPAAPADDPAFTTRETIDIFQLAGGANRLISRSYALNLAAPGAFELRVTPLQGQALIAGLVVEPVPAR